MLKYVQHLKFLCLLSILCWQIDPAYSDNTVPRIVSSVEPPTNFYENNSFVGITVDIVHAIMAELDETYPIEVYPWARTITILERGPNVFGFTAGKTKARTETGFHFIGPVVSRTHALYSHQPDANRISDPAQILQDNKIVGGMRGDWRVLFFKDRGINVQTTSNHLQSLKKLINGRIDYWVSSDLELSYHLQNRSHMQRILTPVYEIARKPSYIMASPQTAKPLFKKWQNAFESLRHNGTLEKIAQKWAAKTGLAFRYAPQHGIFIEQKSQ